MQVSNQDSLHKVTSASDSDRGSGEGANLPAVPTLSIKDVLQYCKLTNLDTGKLDGQFSEETGLFTDYTSNTAKSMLGLVNSAIDLIKMGRMPTRLFERIFQKVAEMPLYSEYLDKDVSSELTKFMNQAIGDSSALIPDNSRERIAKVDALAFEFRSLAKTKSFENLVKILDCCVALVKLVDDEAKFKAQRENHESVRTDAEANREAITSILGQLE